MTRESLPSPILLTKFYRPPLRPQLVPRSELVKRLNQGLDPGVKLTLISAPAGFGKSTLVAEWIQAGGHACAWLSLEAADDTLPRFLTYCIAALQTMLPDVGTTLLPALQSSTLPPLEPLLIELTNELTTSAEPVTLVLDDYHVIENSAIDSALTFLLDHLPPQIHVVMTTREDPPLPLALYRVRGQLVEVRAADLRFTPAEAAEFLNQVMGLTLSMQEIAALERRTEGWVAGLQMAALSLQGRSDGASFIQAFTGSHRFVLDYLAGEVLQRQPEPLRYFLLQTAILARLCGPLCDAVTMREDGRETLERVERGNLFVIPLDDQRQWVRYHHLFAEVLQTRLMQEEPEAVPELHRRASAWYAQNDLPADAIHHALAAADFERAADLIELAWPPIYKGFQPALWLGWVKALPDELVQVRPVLSVGYAWTLLDGGELEGVEARLNDAERWLDSRAEVNQQPENALHDAETPPLGTAGTRVVNEEEFRALPATIAMGRAYLARARGDEQAIMKYAGRALDLLPTEKHYWRGIAAMFLGLAHQSRGDLEAAYHALANSVASLHRAGHIHFQLVNTVTMADIKVAQGQLRAAARLYEQALQLAAEMGGQAKEGTASLYAGLSELHREQGDQAVATAHLRQGEAVAAQAVSPASQVRLYTAMARIKETAGEIDGALDLLHAAERLYKRHPFPTLRPPASLQTRMWLRQGRLAEALAWVSAQDFSADDALNYRSEFDHITLVRVYLAQSRHERAEQVIDEAISLLERLLQAAEAGGRGGSVIEILVLQALAHQVQGTIPAALQALSRALTLAKPEGYLRIFVDEGEPLQPLLAESLARGADPAYVTQVLTAIHQETAGTTAGEMTGETIVPDANQLLIEPLSPRELEVLGLLAIGHTNQAVADELVIAVSTVKKHVNNIFGKLGVGSRTQAINRARELGLL
ncbi:MAG: LuxR C-terminal-related transcriptional regulator [Caldilineaceae bacterium]